MTMGIKSTMKISRGRAERMYAEFRARELERQFRAQAVAMNNVELEDELERLNDEYYQREYGYGSTGFDNYIIEGGNDRD